jgi:hypothetical protein
MGKQVLAPGNRYCFWRPTSTQGEEASSFKLLARLETAKAIFQKTIATMLASMTTESPIVLFECSFSGPSRLRDNALADGRNGS